MHCAHLPPSPPRGPFTASFRSLHVQYLPIEALLATVPRIKRRMPGLTALHIADCNLRHIAHITALAPLNLAALSIGEREPIRSVCFWKEFVTFRLGAGAGARFSVLNGEKIALAEAKRAQAAFASLQAFCNQVGHSFRLSIPEGSLSVCVETTPVMRRALLLTFSPCHSLTRKLRHGLDMQLPAPVSMTHASFPAPVNQREAEVFAARFQLQQQVSQQHHPGSTQSMGTPRRGGLTRQSSSSSAFGSALQATLSTASAASGAGTLERSGGNSVAPGLAASLGSTTAAALLGSTSHSGNSNASGAIGVSGGGSSAGVSASAAKGAKEMQAAIRRAVRDVLQESELDHILEMRVRAEWCALAGRGD